MQSIVGRGDAMPEPIIMEDPDGKQAMWAAEVIRSTHAGRVTIATLYVVGGLLGGTACIVIPILHLFTTWGFPLLGILMAVRTMKRDVLIYQPEGPCPVCAEPIELAGGLPGDSSWQVCPECKAALHVRVPEQTMQTERGAANADS
jgi:hypothetical protein